MKAFPKDVNVQSMTIRHIGVENELGVVGSVEIVEKECNKRGLLQSIGYDGGGREFRTNPISVRSLNQIRGHKYLTEYYSVLKENTRTISGGGTHIHISILKTDHENMESNATAMAIAFYKQFQKISGRKSNWAWQFQKNTLEDVRDYLNQHKRNDRTYSMKGTMLNPTYHSTLEFRGGRGSNDCREILAWVEFLNNITKLCNRKSIEGVQFKQLLKGERIEAYVASLKGWRKINKKDLERKFNGSALTKGA